MLNCLNVSNAVHLLRVATIKAWTAQQHPTDLITNDLSWRFRGTDGNVERPPGTRPDWKPRQGREMNQYAIRRDFTQFLGPFRCQACIGRNSDCVVNKHSTSCDRCSSEAQCLFTRSISIERTGTKRNFSWDELNGEIALRKSAQQIQSNPQSIGSLSEHEEFCVHGDPYSSHDFNDSDGRDLIHSPFANASPYNNEYSIPVSARISDQTLHSLFTRYLG